MKYFYKLVIDCNKNDPKRIDEILSIECSSALKHRWELEYLEEENDPYNDYINKFLDILEGKYNLLENICVQREHISIWILYEYDQMCNMEFYPSQMKRLGKNGITLCVSCWKHGDKIKF